MNSELRDSILFSRVFLLFLASIVIQKLEGFEPSGLIEVYANGSAAYYTK
jgi:hypothetical protein